jgi:Bacterial SH3 domain
MTPKQKNLIIGGAAALLAIVGLVFIFKGGGKKDDVTPPSPGPNPNPNPNPDPFNPTPTPPVSGFSKYRVTTLVSNLNVRQSASTSAPVVGSLPKDSIVYAKPSSTTGWYVYSANGTTDSGFVSSLYLTKI